jgi:hypothetical protein
MELSAPNDALDANSLPVSAGVYTDAGSTLATNGQNVYQFNDATGSGNVAMQTTSNARPVIQSFGRSGFGDGSQSCLRFNNVPPYSDPLGQTNCSSPVEFMNLPSVTLMGNGTVANEGTFFITFRTGTNFGGPINIGGDSLFVSLWTGVSSGVTPSLYTSGGGPGFQGFPNICPLQMSGVPLTVAVRFAASGGVVGADETRIMVNGLYQDVVNSNWLPASGGTLTGGYLGQALNASNFLGITGDIFEVSIWNCALTTAQMTTISQAMQMKAMATNDKYQLMTLTDSKGLGYTTSGTIPATAVLDRSWPVRAVKRIGQTRLLIAGERGLTIAQLQTRANALTGFPNTAYYTNPCVVIAAGINDITAGTSAANVLYGGTSGTGTYGNPATGSLLFLIKSQIQNLAQLRPIAGGKVIVCTIVAGAGLGSISVVNAVNAALRTPGYLPSGTVLCDWANDPRLQTAYCIGSDSVHETDYGYAVEASLIAPALQSAFGSGGLLVVGGVGM